MSEIPNFPEPSWSTTRQSCYDSCPRQYYFQYYASWQGWPKGNRFNEPESRMAYFWSKRETIPTWTGKHVHDAIAQCLSGEPLQEVLERTLRCVADEWHRSNIRGRAFRQRGVEACKYPKEILLMEHIEKDLPDEILDEVLSKVSECLEAFSTLGIESQFSQARICGERYHFVERPGGRFEPRMVEFVIHGQVEPLKVWSMMDCAYELEQNRCVIYDWKTGREPSDRGESHLTDQLIVYAHYVLGAKGIKSRPANFEIEAFEVYLPSCVSFGGPVTIGDLEDARERISRRATDLLELHNRIREQGGVACEAMPTQQVCGNCSYRSMCKFAWKKEV